MQFQDKILNLPAYFISGTSLDMTVYSWKEDIENGESIMQIEFRPIEYGKDYDLVHNPDKYVLLIDGTEIK